MKSDVHNATELIMLALGPAFHEIQSWETIRVAMCLIMARVIQGTPYRGQEPQILIQSQEDIANALEQILKLEEEAINAKAAARDRALRGIEGFSSLEPVNGHDHGPALVGADTKETIIDPQCPVETEEAVQESSWADSTIHQAIQDIEAEEAEQAWNDTLKED